MMKMKVQFKTKVKGGKPEADGKTFVLDADKAQAYISRGLAVEIPLTDEEKKAAAEAGKKAAAEAEKAAKAEAEKKAAEAANTGK